MSKILIDADILAHRAAYSTEGQDDEDTKDKIDDLIDHVLDKTQFEINYKLGEFFLTGSSNFRYDIAVTAPYKENRSGRPRPGKLDVAREYITETYSATISVDQEADDDIAIRATEIGPHALIASIDKDFLQVPCRHYNWNRNEFTVIDEFTGLYNFYTQVLTGDTADNIKGLYRVGPKTAAKMLANCKTEDDLFEVIYRAYEGDLERITENGRLLWLRREPDQLWEPPELVRKRNEKK